MDLGEVTKALEFVNLAQADESTAESVRQIRNEIDVRKNMYTDHEIGVDEHSLWIETLRRSDDHAFFAVAYRNEVIGGVGYSSLSRAHRRADWAYYLSGAGQGRGLGSALEFRFLDYMFQNDFVNKLNCEVIAWNTAVVKLHKRFGFLQEGVRRDHVVRNGDSHDVILLGIKKEEWRLTRADLTERLFKNV